MFLGLAGKSDWERAQVNEILDFHKDSYSALSPYFYVIYGFREGDKVTFIFLLVRVYQIVKVIFVLNFMFMLT